MIYDLDLKKRWDDYSALETATRIGKVEGEKRKSREVVINLIANTDFEDNKIADLISVSESFVQKIRKEIEAEK